MNKKIVILFILFNINIVFGFKYNSQTVPDTFPPAKKEIDFLKAVDDADYSFKSGIENYNTLYYDSAIYYFKQSIKQLPYGNLSYYWLSQCYFKLGQYDEALRFLNIEKKYYPKSDFLNNKIEFLKSQKDIKLNEKMGEMTKADLLKEIQSDSYNNKKFISPINIKYYKKRIYLLSISSHNLIVIDDDYNLVNYVDELVKPYGLDVKNDKIYISELNKNLIKIYDLNCNLIKTMDLSKHKVFGISNISVYKNYIYAVDEGNNKIIKINEKNEVVAYNKLSEPGKIKNIYYHKDCLYVLVKNIIYKLDTSLNIIDKIILDKDINASSIIVNKSVIMVSENSDTSLIRFFDMTGKQIQVLKNMKDKPLISSNNYSFSYNPKGLIYLIDYKKNILSIYQTVNSDYKRFFISLDRIDYRNFKPMIVQDITITDIYGNYVPNINYEHIELYENYKYEESPEVYKYSFSKIEKDTFINFRKQYIRFPVSIKSAEIYDPIRQVYFYLDNNTKINKNKNFILELLDKTLKKLNLKKYKLNLLQIRNKKNVLTTLKNSTDIFELKREIENIKFNRNLDLINSIKLLSKKIYNQLSMKFLVIFTDKSDDEFFNLTERKIELIRFLNNNHFNVIFINLNKNKSKSLEQFSKYCKGKYFNFLNMNSDKFIQTLNNTVENRYTVIYKSKKTKNKKNTYKNIYLKLNYLNSDAALRSGYFTY